ncbi:MAG: LysR family transcriptional regulator [Halomonas sp.]|uniref:LysR family transcriptional regulator n=1 Tax=Halomonas sp. TaxID=1486246 RepID=UPI0028700AE0|nr:LysR family transcriptional regulator [Halomonas sp.]MDR9438359.1 LysR family transcriptional regulator [Halomonas sp.]
MSARKNSPLLDDLHLLTVLAQVRSFTKAARRLGVSKASVSTRIASLERAVGVPLVRRTTRSVVLTDAGLQLVEDIEPSFVRIEQSLSSVKDLAGNPRGLLRLSAPVALGRQRIAPMIPAFLQRYPEIRLELDLSDRFVNLAQEGFDLAIRHAQTVPETHVAWVLRESRSLLVASHDYLERHGVPRHPADLSRHECLMYLRDGSAQSWSFERESGRKRGERVGVPVGGRFKANNSEVLREAVLGGLGIGLLPDFTAVDELRPGRLAQVLPDWKPVGFFGDQLFAIRPWTRQVPRAVQCLVNHLRQDFAAIT